MLLVTGPVSRHMEVALKRTYDATPDPSSSSPSGLWQLGGIFGPVYASLGAVSNVILCRRRRAGLPACAHAPARGILAAISTAASRPTAGELINL